MFIFSTCQLGAESVFKQEIAQLFPGIRGAFARPGFVSFKTENVLENIPQQFLERSLFARSASVSLGKIELDSPFSAAPLSVETDAFAEKLWKIAAEHHLFVNRVHVFCRDSFPVGEQSFEPHIPPELAALHRIIVAQSPMKKFLGHSADSLFHPALPNETVLDVVQIEPNLFFVGSHTVTETSPVSSRYSGGILPLDLDCEMVSRAFLKFNEGVLWTGITFNKGEQCLDIGASPGGCSQFLLQQGVKVIGVDPGEMHPTVLEHPQFTHIRRRIKDVKKSAYKNVRWITSDMNVAPNYTLDVLSEAVLLASHSLRGLLFTLKLPHWHLVKHFPDYFDRIRSWGFSDVRAKQLAFNRQEVMVIAKKAAVKK